MDNDININIKFKTVGGSDTPPKKKTDINDELKSKIPQSEKDVDGLEYIEEG